MQLTVTGKGVDVGDALRHRVETSLGSILGKYFGSAIEAHAVFTRERHLIRSDLAIHIGRGIVVNSAGSANEFYAVFDGAAERLAKQLRRYKRRLRDYHAKASRATNAEAEVARSYVLAPPAEEDEDEQETAGAEAAAPIVIAEMSTELPSLTVGEAVMRMDLADAPVLLFRNRSHGALNVVYRRGDGNIGWIDPNLQKASR